jgi:hypothetical protein
MCQVEPTEEASIVLVEGATNQLVAKEVDIKF